MKFANFSHIWAKRGMTPHQRYEELWRELQLCDELGFDYGFCVEHHFRRGQSQGNIEVTGSPTLRFIIDLLLRLGLSTPRNQYIVSLWLAMHAAQKTATNRLSAPPQLAA